MSLDFFRLMGGIEIEKDDLSARAQVLVGSGVPGGDTGEQDAAPIGSVFLRTDAASGENFYWKWQSTNAAADWKIGVSKDYVDALTGGTSWREPVRVIDGTLYADSSAFPVGGTVVGVALADQDRVLFSNVTTGNDNIYIWNAGTSTWSEDILNPNSDGDAVFVKDGTNADSLYFFNGTNWIKYADSTSYAELGYLRSFVGKGSVGSVMPDYTSVNVVADSDSLVAAISKLDTEAKYADDFMGKAVGNSMPSFTSNNVVVDGDSLQLSTDKLDAEIGYIESFIGKAVGNEMPTYSSVLVVTQNGSLEAAIGELDLAMGDGNITNVGGNYSLVSDMTWFSGANDLTEALNQLNNAIGDRNYTNFVTVPVLIDGQSVAASLEALNLAIGERAYTSQFNITNAQSSAASIDALDLAIGSRLYTNDRVVTDGQSVTASIDALDTAVGVLQDLTKASTGTNVTASSTVVDSIPVSEATEVIWMIQVRETSTTANRRSMEVHAMTDGTLVDHTEFAVLKLGAAIGGFNVDVDVSGGNIRLKLSATNNVDYVVKRVSYSAF